MSYTDPIGVIRQRLRDLYGFQYGEQYHAQMKRNVLKAAESMQVDGGVEGFAKWLTRPGFGHADLFAVARHFTVGETYFFREWPAFQLFTNNILPNIIDISRNSGDVYKIWSAGCSSGEEPYSLAMMVYDAFNGAEAPVRIVATDLNNTALEKARSGIYTRWSFRTTPPEMQKRFFVEKGAGYVLSEKIVKMVTFLPLNLVSDPYPFGQNANGNHGCDLIFCRNVLMYFAPEVITTIVNRLYDLLNPGGWLITSQVELNDFYFGRFKRIMENDGVFYQKPLPGETVASKAGENYVSKAKTHRTVPPLEKTISKNRKTPGKPKLSPAVKPAGNGGANVAIVDHEALAWRLIDDGKHAECVKHCTAILNSGAYDAKIAHPLAKALANSGQTDKALDIVEQLISRNQVCPDYYYLRANIISEKGFWEEAITDLRKVLYLDHQHIAARFSLVMMLNKLNHNDKLDKEAGHLLKLLANYEPDDKLPAMDGVTAAQTSEWLEQIKISRHGQ